MQNIQKNIWKIILAGITSTFLYAFLHELGHCIAVWYYGGRITEFQFILLWNAHVHIEGEIGWKPLIDLAGSLFPILIAFCLLFTYRWDSKKTFIYYLKTIYIIESLFSLSSWIVLSILYLNGSWHLSEDAHQFLMKSGISPVVVIFVTMIIILLMFFILIKKAMAAASSEWSKKCIKRMGICFGVVQLLTIFILPLFMRLDTLGNVSFQLTEKDGNPDSLLKKQYEAEIEEDGTYYLDMWWGGECEGVITGVTLSLGDAIVFDCTAEKITMQSGPLELERGTYTFSIYCLRNMKELETFYAMIDEEAPALEDYSFQDGRRFAVFGGYHIKTER